MTGGGGLVAAAPVTNSGSSSKVPFGIADPDLPIHYATFMGLQ